MKRTSLWEMDDRAAMVVKTAQERTRRVLVSKTDDDLAEGGLKSPARAKGRLVVQRRGSPWER